MKKSLFIQFANLECEIIAPLEWRKYFLKVYGASTFMKYSEKRGKKMHQATLKIKNANSKDITFVFRQKPTSTQFSIEASPAPLFLFPAAQQCIARIFNILLHKAQGFVLHASAALVNGKAVIFTGKAGSGKSTIVEFIKQQRPKSVILADNSAFIQKRKKTFVIYPSPFMEANRTDALFQLFPGNPPFEIGAVFSPLPGDRHRIENFNFWEKVSLIQRNSHIPFHPDRFFYKNQAKRFGALIFKFIDAVGIYQLQFAKDPGFIPLIKERIKK